MIQTLVQLACVAVARQAGGMRKLIRLILFCLLLTPAPARAELLGIMPVELLDTSGEPQEQDAQHDRWRAQFAEIVAREVRGQVISPTDLAAACPDRQALCMMELLRERGVDSGVFIVVQKSSTLILQVFANVVPTREIGPVRSHRLSFRGDNEEAWRRAAGFFAAQLLRAD